ncbi:MAG TPA: hypothetical protein VFS39_01895, partial [Nitrospira sp.]|nr:hypothetical protein [Nitrospira sp.]
ATRLLSDDADDIVDVEILEKYRPSFQHLGVPFVLEEQATVTDVVPGLSISRRATREIRSLVTSTDCTLVFL